MGQSSPSQARAAAMERKTRTPSSSSPDGSGGVGWDRVMLAQGKFWRATLSREADIVVLSMIRESLPEELRYLRGGTIEEFGRLNNLHSSVLCP